MAKYFVYFSVFVLLLSVKCSIGDNLIDYPLPLSLTDESGPKPDVELQETSALSDILSERPAVAGSEKKTDHVVVTQTNAVDHPPSQSTPPNTNTPIQAQQAANEQLDAFFGVESCMSTCDAVYNMEMDSSFCKRGCRLLMVIDFMGATSDLNEVNNKCTSACHEAYAESNNATACQFGCQSQLPAAQRRQQQMLDYEREQLAYRAYYARMMSSMLECITRQFNARWSALIPSEDGATIILGFDSGVEGEEPGNKMAAGGDGLAMDVLKRESQAGLGSPKSLVFFVGLGVVVLIWYSLVILATSRKNKATYQKLSINGDLDYLSTLDDKQLIHLLRPQEACQQAPPLPIKIQINSI